MFEKKYVFETRSTKQKRILFNGSIAIITAAIFLGLFSLYLPTYAKKEREWANQALYNKAPDVIVVLTGDSGRIAYALDLAKKYESAKIFITGVYAKNSLATLVKSLGRDISVDEFLAEQSHHIELDYLARNTVENGLATLHFLQKHPEYKRVLLVTSDYHIMRTNLIIETLFQNETGYTFYYNGIASDYNQWRSIKILFKEVYKILKTSSFLFFWDAEPYL
jgi:uncharacterized SAM-binding protein YcdF (DUF218 family)